MNDKLRELYEKVSGDESLKESFIQGLEAISNDDEKKSFIIEFAKEQGITLTEEDFPNTDGVHNISDDDLDKVVGGGMGDFAEEGCGSGLAAFCGAFFGMSYIADLTRDC